MIANQLPGLMAEKGISIRELSRRTGVTYTTIWALYHGRRESVQLTVLDAVCAALGVQPGDIYHFIAAGEGDGPGLSPVAPEPTHQAPRPSATRVRSDDWSVWD